MKLLSSPNDTPTNKISACLLVAFVVALPFDQFYSELVLVCFGLHTLLSLKKENLRFLFRKELLLLVSLFLVAAVCALYTTNRAEAGKLLSRQLALVLFPVLLFIQPLALKKYSRLILLSFAFSCTAALAYLYADAIRVIRFYHLPLSALLTPAFMNHNFSEPIDMHATYLSLYLGLSFAIFLNTFLTSPGRITKLLSLGATLFLLLGLLQLGSRAVLAGVLILSGVVPFFLPGKRKRHYALLLSFTVVGLSAMVLAVPSMKHRFVHLLREDLSERTADLSIADPRLRRWELALDLIKVAPFTGYGSGDEVDLLKETYFQHRLYDSYLHRLNAHNQYLSFLLMGGVGALAVYLLGLFYGFRFALRQRSLVALAFVLLVSIVSVSENLLFRNKGIFFYSFFATFFVCVTLRKKVPVPPPEKSTAGNPQHHLHVSTSTI